MAIVSKGYERALTYAEHGELLTYAGASFSVFGASSFEVIPNPADRTLNVQPGRASGRGIVDVSYDVEIVGGDAVPSGSRWDTVVLRRNWADKTSTVMVLKGNSTKALAASRQTVPGVIDDHPLALVRFTAGQTSAQEVVDLRVWNGDGGAAANNDFVRQFLERIGSRVTVGSAVWVRQIVAGVPTWVDARAEITEATTTGTDGGGGKLAKFTPEGRLAVADPEINAHVANKRYVDATLKPTADAVTKATAVGTGTGGGKLVLWGPTGNLLMADPTQLGHGATKRYVDNLTDSTTSGASGGGGKLAKFTPEGRLGMSEPTSLEHGATKRYVDNATDSSTSGLTGAGKLARFTAGGRLIVADPVDQDSAANKRTVDTAAAAAKAYTDVAAAVAKAYTDSSTEASVSGPSGGNKLVRWSASGRIEMADPATPDNGANKRYVDNATAGSTSGPSGGGQLARWSSGGRLDMADPVSPENGANKRYVDQKTADLPIVRGGGFNGDVWNRNLTGTRRAAYITNEGSEPTYLGHQSSAAKYKQDIAEMEISDEQLLSIAFVMYRYREQVAQHGSDAPVDAGMIADALDAAGLGWAVFYNEDGDVEGIHYERAWLAMLPPVQRAIERLSVIEERLAALEGLTA